MTDSTDGGAPLHDAHVATKIDWILTVQNDASRRDARASTLYDRFTDTPDDCQEAAPRDFRAKIKKTKFAKDHHQRLLKTHTEAEAASQLESVIDQIDAAFNEYHDLAADRGQATDQATEQREKARKLIQDLHGAFEAIARNPTAKEAVINAFCAPQSDAIDSKIDELNLFVKNIRLAQQRRGPKGKPELQRLIARVGEIVMRARIEPKAKFNDGTAVEYVTELLEAGQANHAHDTVKTALTEIRRAQRHYLEIATGASLYDRLKLPRQFTK